MTKDQLEHSISGMPNTLYFMDEKLNNIAVLYQIINLTCVVSMTNSLFKIFPLSTHILFEENDMRYNFVGLIYIYRYNMPYAFTSLRIHVDYSVLHNLGPFFFWEVETSGWIAFI